MEKIEKSEDTIQITISKEVYDKLLKNRSYSKAIKYALISDKTVQITISKEAYENLNSLIALGSRGRVYLWPSGRG